MLQKNITLLQQVVNDLIISNDTVEGVLTNIGLVFRAKTVILTVGTFLGGKIYIGSKFFEGGRIGDSFSSSLSKKLCKFPFKVSRLKTGTPPRIAKRSVNYFSMDKQLGNPHAPYFSFFSQGNEHPFQTACYISYTNNKTHSIIAKNLHRSATYNGVMPGIGPRYCPSIEDKIVRFPNKDRHQIFIEPEGLGSMEVYPNGISTSLPFNIQLQFIRSIEGFENAQITRPGYAVEYDFFDPSGLQSNLETKYIKNLFFAGQINGTTGYEEAAAQGIIAGINAVLNIDKKSSWTPKRNEAYIGVLIDDLVTQGINEPYRMFTSRAEYRLILREDNAHIRLCPEAIRLGLLSRKEVNLFQKKQRILLSSINCVKFTSKSVSLPSAFLSINKFIKEYKNPFNFLRYNKMHYEDLTRSSILHSFISDERIIREVETIAKYSGYIERQTRLVRSKEAFEHCIIPLSFNYNKVSGLSHEACQKLVGFKPTTLGEASRISGITSSIVSLLIIYMKKIGLIKANNISSKL
jgi:tRNA uridine 5-carboxymethylaminomethyl modification enzyme